MRKVATTVAHLLPVQVVGRPLRAIRRRFARPAKLRKSDRNRRHLNVRRPFPDGVTGPESQSASFLNRHVDLTIPVAWEAPLEPALFRYNLNYFNFLAGLDQTVRDSLCHDWISSNRPFKSIGWDAYPTSLRIINWCKYASIDGNVAASLYTQADYLSRFTETHLLGNHLLENARALLFAANIFRDLPISREWELRALQIYKSETPVQVLADGGHYERSPMYHAIALEGYLDAINLLPPDHAAVPRLLATGEKMMGYLCALSHPDGRVALFNDSTLEVAKPTKQLLEYLADMGGQLPDTRSQFRSTGYYTYRDDTTYVVVDAGPIGPDFLPAHAHADILSFEMSRNGRRFIVDTGVSEYVPGETRNYQRSTAAHNTVEIDGVSQVECWGSFRVGRRFRPQGISFIRNISGFEFRGAFSGYRALLGDQIVHTRTISLQHDRLVVRDDVTGSGAHVVTSRLHFHPDVAMRDLDDGSVMLSLDSEQCLLRVEGGEITLSDGWYCPEFGKKTPNRVLELGVRGQLPVALKITISFQSANGQ